MAWFAETRPLSYRNMNCFIPLCFSAHRSAPEHISSSILLRAQYFFLTANCEIHPAKSNVRGFMR